MKYGALYPKNDVEMLNLPPAKDERRLIGYKTYIKSEENLAWNNKELRKEIHDGRAADKDLEL